ncbi:MAG: PEP-CTERM sorting domain-containing protein [Phycisphaerales bacterium]
MRKHRTVTRLGIIAAALCLTTAAQAATYTWNTGNGNWSAAGSWIEGVPSTDGSADISLTQSVGGILTSTVDAAWGTPADRLVNSVTFTGPNRLDLSMAGGVVLNVANGVYWNSIPNTGQINGTVNFPNATATVDITNISNAIWNANITSTSGTEINKTGAGEIRFNGGTTGSNVSWKLTQGQIRFFNNNQYERLGTVGLTVMDANSTTLGFNPSTFAGDVVRTFSTPIVFNGSFASKLFTFNPSGLGTNNTSVRLNVDAGWSSTLDLTGVSNGGSIWFAGANDSRAKTWFNADSGGLTSTADLSTNGRTAIFIRGGYFVLNHDNALGTGNNLSFLLGEANVSGGSNSALLATNGHDVTGHIGLKAGGGNSSTLVPLTAFVGLEGTGGTNFTGNIYLATSTLAYQVPTLALTAPTGGTATFTGVIANAGSFTFKSAVKIVGGGKIVLTNTNTYTNTTTVTENSTLAVNGSLTNSSVVVDAGSTLQGIGSVANAVTVAGSLAPGNSIGTLSVGSAVITGSLDIELEPAGVSDLLSVAGDLNISAATLNLTNLGGAFDGSTYIIASYGSLTGAAFAAVTGLTNGYTVDYNYLGGNQIALLVPEPATLGLMALGGLMIAFRRGRGCGRNFRGRK